MNSIKNSPFFYKIITSLLYGSITRKYAIRYIENKIAKNFGSSNNQKASSKKNKRLQYEKKIMALSIIKTLDRSIERNNLDRNIAQEVLKLWANALTGDRLKNKEVKKFYIKNKSMPPFMLVISPGHGCNLRCRGCYASSKSNGQKLPWNVLDRLISDAKKLWDIKLIVFSGGEPFYYNSEDKGILDIAKKYKDCLFLAFSNGTLLNKRLSQEIAECKNITPAFSVEGLEEETNRIRGEGVFEKVLGSMELMKKAGIPFGISVTVNSDNYNKVLKDKFLDFFFHQMGVFYAFYFQYLPIGRALDFKYMPSSMQRVDFWSKIWRQIENKGLFLIDFWNHGPLVGGCISAGREGGYLYIDWNGKVMPCVFMPYSIGNIYRMYKEGKTLNHLWEHPFLAKIRNWQKNYGFGKEANFGNNLLRPCPYRDHHLEFLKWIKELKTEPEDESASKILSDCFYHKKMISYGKKLANLFDPVWEEKYLK